MNSYQGIKKAYEFSQYKFFTDAYALNIFGVRSGFGVVNEFNDVLGVAFVDAFGNENCIMSEGTTKPGLYWLKNKLGNKNGTFILAVGQYLNCWEIRKHNGDYSALCQVHGYKGFVGWRDNDSDGDFDVDGDLYGDVTGLNMHHAKDRGKVGAYSAGCQTRKSDSEHEMIMGIVRNAADIWKSKLFSYTLFNDHESP